MVKIVTLIENLVTSTGFIGEHGLSVYIESDDKKILLDTGFSNGFLHNAERLGVDISAVDYLIISHGHHDHIGGLIPFMEKNSKSKIILKEESSQPKFNGKWYIGHNPEIDFSNSRFLYVEDILEVVPNIFIFPSIHSFFPVDSHKNGFFVEKNGLKSADLFDDELFLCLKNDGKLTILSSCSHNGISNICETARQHFQLPIERVIGGFHTKKDELSMVDHIVNYFNMLGVTEIDTCHCTGVDKFAYLAQHCKATVNYNYTGSQIIIE
jgi:7,8-dihydropterin-6-yl-methyl-4-(beta-D-ribofuranosyl)aminobenzene 5'-phosphate synthase